jgi:hypothetical protein
VPRLGGFSAQNDQVAAGAVMWVIGSLAFLIPAAVIAVRLLSPATPRVKRQLPSAVPESRILSLSLPTLTLILPLAAIGYGLLAPEKIDIDGDIVRMQGVSGPFHISVFTAPDPLPGGEFEVAILIQDRETSSAILDSAVSIAVQPLEGGSPKSARASREQATNKLLEVASVDLLSPGIWELRVSVRRGNDQGSLAGKLEVSPANGRRGINAAATSPTL